MFSAADNGEARNKFEPVIAKFYSSWYLRLYVIDNW